MRQTSHAPVSVRLFNFNFLFFARSSTSELLTGYLVYGALTSEGFRFLLFVAWSQWKIRETLFNLSFKRTRQNCSSSMHIRSPNTAFPLSHDNNTFLSPDVTCIRVRHVPKCAHKVHAFLRIRDVFNRILRFSFGPSNSDHRRLLS